MRILLSNDDGIHAPGIRILAEQLRTFADVMVVAPDRNRSGSSNSLSLDKPLRVARYGEQDIAVISGTPADCVYLGVNRLMRPRPDIVVSGINAGANLGDDVIYSGTVAAAMEGRHLGLPALAVSLKGITHYETAAIITAELLQNLQRIPLRTNKMLNINVPDVPLAAIKGYKVTRCGTRHPAETVYQQKDPKGRDIYWLGPQGEELDASEETDFMAVAQNYVSITPLQVDLTAYSVQDKLSSWLKKCQDNAQ